MRANEHKHLQEIVRLNKYTNFIEIMGQTITLSHLAPFVDISRQKLRKRFAKEFKEIGLEISQDKIDEFAEKELIKEVEAGCQTLQYQLVTLHSTNG